jgi:hypothetical protein
VLSDIDSRGGVQAYILLGDLIDYGPHSNEVIDMVKSSCPSLSCGRIEFGIDLLLCLVVSSQFNYTKGSGIYAFSIAFIIEFSRFNTPFGVGSFS